VLRWAAFRFSVRPPRAAPDEQRSRETSEGPGCAAGPVALAVIAGIVAESLREALGDADLDMGKPAGAVVAVVAGWRGVPVLRGAGSLAVGRAWRGMAQSIGWSDLAADDLGPEGCRKTRQAGLGPRVLRDVLGRSVPGDWAGGRRDDDAGPCSR